MKPDFICPGFPKCGTTTLHDILKQHKDIMLPAIKEPMFYGSPHMYKKGFSWYENRYYDKGKNYSNKLVGEINPLLTIGFYAKRISKDFDKNTKFIFMLRNPVKRIYSDFKMSSIWGGWCTCPLDYEKALSKNGFREFVESNFTYDKNLKKVYKNKRFGLGINNSNYYMNISSFLKCYPISNMKFIIFEEFIKDTEKTCDEIIDFLGLEKDKNINYNINSNSGNRRPINVMSMKIADLWIGKCWRKIILDKVPYVNYKFSEFLNDIYWNMFDLLTVQDNEINKIDYKSKKILEMYYKEDKEKLENLIGRDLKDLWF